VARKTALTGAPHRLATRKRRLRFTVCPVGAARIGSILRSRIPRLLHLCNLPSLAKRSREEGVSVGCSPRLRPNRQNSGCRQRMRVCCSITFLPIRTEAH